MRSHIHRATLHSLASTPTTAVRSRTSARDRVAEAKADFQKVVELQADGEMATMSKKALEQLK